MLHACSTHVLTTLPLTSTVFPEASMFCSTRDLCSARYGSVNKFCTLLLISSFRWYPKSSQVISLAVSIREVCASMVMMALLGFRAAVGKRVEVVTSGEEADCPRNGMLNEELSPCVNACTNEPPAGLIQRGDECNTLDVISENKSVNFG